MKTVFILCAFLVFAGCSRQVQPWSGKVIDLSYSYDDSTIYWPTEKGFDLQKGSAGMTPTGYFYSANRFWTPEHGGTHIDAPYHFSEKGHTVDEIAVDELIGSGIVVDVSEKCIANRDYRVEVEDFQKWEKKNGRIPDGTIVLLRTGFGKYWPDRVKYMGTNDRGQEAVAKLHFPGLHPDAAKWITTNRKVKAVGLDTPSIDYGQSSRFESHVALFEKNVPALENVANLDQLPQYGFTVVALPMKIKGGSGGPVRIVAVMN